MEITIQQATTAYQEGKLEEAERLYRSLLEANPNNLDANNNLGVLLYSLEKLKQVLIKQSHLGQIMQKPITI